MLRAMFGLHRRTFLIAVGGAALFALCTVASSMAVEWVTDHVIVPRFEEGSVAAGTVATGVGLIIGIGLLRATGVVVRRTWAGTTQWRVAGTLGQSVVDRLVRQPMSWHARRPDGDLVARAGVDTDAAVSVLAPVPFACGTVLLILVSAVFLLTTDLILGAVAVAVFPLLIGLNVIYQKRVDVYYQTAQEHLGALSAGVHESFDGVQLVKAYGAEVRETERLAEMAGHLRTARVSAVRLRGTFEALLDVLPSMTNVGLVLLGAARVSSGDLTVGQLSSFVYLFTLLVFPLRLIGYALSELPHSLAGWRRVRTVLDEPIEPDPARVDPDRRARLRRAARQGPLHVRRRVPPGVVRRVARRPPRPHRRHRRPDRRRQDHARRDRRRARGPRRGHGRCRRWSAGDRVPGAVPVLRDDPPQPRARRRGAGGRPVGGAAPGPCRPLHRRHTARPRHRRRRARREPQRRPASADRARPAPSCGARPCCCSTTRRRRSTRPPRVPCWATCAAC